MASTSYYTVGGRILGQRDSSGDRTDYVRDQLGSVIATTNQSGTVLNRYRYQPYGGIAEKTGTAPDPRFQWVGAHGSRTTEVSNVSNYIRYRHYGAKYARWTTVDPLWPSEPAYIYVANSPVVFSDPDGLIPINKGNCKDAGDAPYYIIPRGNARGRVVGVPLPKPGEKGQIQRRRITDFEPRENQGPPRPGNHHSERCVCTNGSYFNMTTGEPIGRVRYDGCGSTTGRNFGPEDEFPNILRFGNDWIGDREGDPPGHLERKPRTYACVSVFGIVIGLYVVPPPGMTYKQAKQCLKCPPGSRLRPMDGGGSTALVEFPCDGPPIEHVKSSRGLANIVCFCEPC